MFSEVLDRGAQHALAALAELTAAASDTGVQHHTLAGFQQGLGRVNLLDDARAIEPHDLRQPVRDACAAVAHVEVNPVEGGGVHADQDFARAAYRLGSLADLHNFIAAVACDDIPPS